MLRLIMLAMLGAASGFKFMSNWKMPTVIDMLKQQEAAEKFGDKKLVVITGTSSGLGRATARALLRTGKCAVAALTANYLLSTRRTGVRVHERKRATRALTRTHACMKA